MNSNQKWLMGILCFLLAAVMIMFLVILPRAFDRRWQFWGDETPQRIEPAAPPAVEEEEETSEAPEAEMPLLDCGVFGTYTPVPVGDNWEYWMQEPDKVSGQYGLVELKLRGGECKFTVPDGYVAIWNQSAGSININGEKGSLGNPVKLNGSEFLTGDILSSWGEKNDSAGVMITLISE